MKLGCCRYVVLVTAAALYGCGESQPEVSWQPVPDPPSAEIQAALDKADAAVGELGGNLISALQRALEDGGPDQAIQVCQQIAPRLAQQAGTAHGVEIGRTSFRLRNQNNRTPAWARSAVQQKSAETSAFVSSQGVVARLKPIPMMPLCAQCHGTADEISTDVREALATHYPDDMATGFQQGEIRGYFWVEVDTNADER